MCPLSPTNDRLVLFLAFVACLIQLTFMYTHVSLLFSGMTLVISFY